jgi:hypothetical protein
VIVPAQVGGAPGVPNATLTHIVGNNHVTFATLKAVRYAMHSHCAESLNLLNGDLQ